MQLPQGIQQIQGEPEKFTRSFLLCHTAIASIQLIKQSIPDAFSLLFHSFHWPALFMNPACHQKLQEIRLKQNGQNSKAVKDLRMARKSLRKIPKRLAL